MLNKPPEGSPGPPPLAQQFVSMNSRLLIRQRRLCAAAMKQQVFQSSEQTQRLGLT